MKNLVLFSLFCFSAIGILSCKKSNETKPTSAPTIIGHWNVVSDSSYDALNSAFDGKYIGLSVDYFVFKSGNKLSWHEESVGSDSGSFLVGTGGLVTISYFPKSDPHYSDNTTLQYKIVSLTDNQLVLYSYVAGTAGIINEVLTLSR